MEVLRLLTSNYIVNIGVISWVSAQLLKTLFTLILTKKLQIERLFGAGGMPSSHSALTTSIAVGMVRKMGFAAPEVGLALAFAGVVMYDAMGVRRAAGEQAKVLNKMIFNFTLFSKNEKSSSQAPSPLIKKELKEFLGHTPLEVLGGCLLGILVAMFVPVV